MTKMNNQGNIHHENFTKLIVLGSVALGGYYISLMEPLKLGENLDLGQGLKPGEKESISETVTKKVYFYVKSREQEGQMLQNWMSENKADMQSDFVKEQIKSSIKEIIKEA